MRIFNIDNGWNIKLPENWKEERDNVDGYHIYYPTDSDLTIRIISFHFFRNIENDWKVLAPVDVLSKIFNESIKNNKYLKFGDLKDEFTIPKKEIKSDKGMER